MASYKKFQSKLNNPWYPRVITTGILITTDRIADELPLQFTTTRGDTYAVFKNLGGVMADYMASGSAMRIDGIGTPYYTVVTNRNGVAMPEEVTSGQINGVRARFIPEVKCGSGKQIITRSMVDVDVTWMDIGKFANGDTSGDGSPNLGDGGSEGGEERDPLG